MTIAKTSGLQSALDGKQPLDADLTSIAGLTGTSGLLRKTAANTWSLDTNSYSLSTHNHGTGNTNYLTKWANTTGELINTNIYNDNNTTRFGSSTKHIAIGNSDLALVTNDYRNIVTNNHGDFLFGVNLELLDDHTLRVVNTHASLTGGAIVVGGNGYPNSANSVNIFTMTPGATNAGTIINPSNANVIINSSGVKLSTLNAERVVVTNSNNYLVSSSVTNNELNCLAGINSNIQTQLNNKQPLDADLTSIAGLTGTSGLLRKTAANTWSLDTNSYSLSTHNHGTGNTNYLTKWANTSGSLTSSIIYDNGSGIGIGTTTVNARLDFGNYYINKTTGLTLSELSSHLKLWDNGSLSFGFGISTSSMNYSVPVDCVHRFWINANEYLMLNSSQLSLLNSNRELVINNGSVRLQGAYNSTYSVQYANLTAPNGIHISANAVLSSDSTVWTAQITGASAILGLGSNGELKLYKNNSVSAGSQISAGSAGVYDITYKNQNTYTMIGNYAKWNSNTGELTNANMLEGIDGNGKSFIQPYCDYLGMPSGNVQLWNDGNVKLKNIVIPSGEGITIGEETAFGIQGLHITSSGTLSTTNIHVDDIESDICAFITICSPIYLYSRLRLTTFTKTEIESYQITIGNYSLSVAKPSYHIVNNPGTQTANLTLNPATDGTIVIFTRGEGDYESIWKINGVQFDYGTAQIWYYPNSTIGWVKVS